MKNDNIAKKLKFYRKQNNLSVHDVACQLSIDQNVVADKTIYGWESGQAQPDADILLKLCKIYHIIREMYKQKTPDHSTFSKDSGLI